jgi:hypothetical protein
MQVGLFIISSSHVLSPHIMAPQQSQFKFAFFIFLHMEQALEDILFLDELHHKYQFECGRCDLVYLENKKDFLVSIKNCDCEYKKININSCVFCDKTTILFNQCKSCELDCKQEYLEPLPTPQEVKLKLKNYLLSLLK